MGVRGEKADDLVGRDAIGDGALHRLLGELAGDEVWETGGEAGEKVENGDMEEGIGVCVESVVGLDDDISTARS